MNQMVPGGSRSLVDINSGRSLVAYQPRDMEPEPEWLDLRELWRTALKYRYTIIAVVLTCVILAWISASLEREVFRAQALVEVLPPNTAGAVKFENVQQGTVATQQFLATQHKVLQSESIGRSVLANHDLANAPELNGQITQRGFRSGLTEIGNLFSEATPAQAADDDARLGHFLSRRSVVPVGGSFLFEIRFESFDPQLAADAANAIAAEYMRMNDVRRLSSTVGSRAYLEEEIHKLQAKLESSEKDLNEFARRNQVVDLEDRSNSMGTRLERLNDELTTVRAERIAAQSVYLQAQQGSATELPQIMNKPLISNLRQQQADLQTEYLRLSKIYKDQYPLLEQTRAQMERVQQTIATEVDNEIRSIGAVYRELLQKEELLAAEVAKLNSDILALQEDAVQYNILKRERETNNELYVGLLERMKELGVAQGLEASNVAIIDPARPPGSPFAPDVTKSVTKALLLGLFLGLSLALLLGFLDNTIRKPEELEETLGLSNLGLVPKETGRRREKNYLIDLSGHLAPGSEVAESFRSIRTSLMFSTPDGLPRSLLVTSASEKEGKTTTAINLAIVLAHTGAKVLLVDCDLRKPRVHRTFKCKLAPGISEHLVNGPLQTIHRTKIKGLSVMSAGTPPPNPAELLGSTVFDVFLQMMKDKFQYVILDSPPILGLADAVVASSKVDGVLTVVSAGKVSKRALRQAIGRLRAVQAPLVGAVLNNVDVSSSEYGEYSRYYYNYKNEPDSGKVAQIKARKKPA